MRTDSDYLIINHGCFEEAKQDKQSPLPFKIKRTKNKKNILNKFK